MQLLLKGGDYSRAATIRGRCLFEEVLFYYFANSYRPCINAMDTQIYSQLRSVPCEIDLNIPHLDMVFTSNIPQLNMLNF